MPKPSTKPKKSQSNLPTVRRDYSVVFINAQNDSLDPILDEFYTEAVLQKRRAIVAINMDYVVMKIMSEKENMDILRARPYLLSGENVPTDIILYIIKQRMDEYLEENDRVLKIQDINKQFDLLNHWTQNHDPVMEQIQPIAPTKGKAIKDKKPLKATTSSTKSKPNLNNTIEPMQKAIPPEYDTKNWSALALRGQNSNLKVYIEDAPIDGPNLYIVILGIYDCKVITELMAQGALVHAIIKMESPDHDMTIFDKHTKFWKDVSRIKTTDSSKPIAFYGIRSCVYPREFIEENILQIGAELSSLVYDTEDLGRQHKHYLENIDELNVDELEPCPDLTEYKEYTSYFDDIKVEHTVVEHVLDALLGQVEALKPNETIQKNTHPSLSSLIDQEEQILRNLNGPFLCCLETQHMLEHQDQLYQEMQDIVDSKFEQYNFRLKSLIEEWKLSELVQNNQNGNLLTSFTTNQKDFLNLEFLLNALYIRGFKLPIPSEDSVSISQSHLVKLNQIMNSIKQNQAEVTECLELLTQQALQQQLAICIKTFDNIKREINPMTNSLILTFSNNDRMMNTNTFEEHLTTKVCFRDYVDYVIDEDCDWILGEEELYEQGLAKTDGAARLGKKSPGSMLPTLPFDEFLLNRSLKKHGNDNFIGDSDPPQNVPEISEVIDKKKGPEKKPATEKKKQKNITTLPSAKNSSPDKSNHPTEGIIDSKEKSFIGYNLDDRRFQLNGKSAIYRSAICTINYNMDSWLYRENIMNVDVEVNGFHLLFGNVFTSRGFPLKNIDYAMVKGNNGMSLTVEVVATDDARSVSVSPSIEHYPDKCRPFAFSLVDPEPRELVLRYTWPNGLIAKTISSTKNYAIEQMWTKPTTEEKGRIFHANGCIVINYTNGKIKFLSPTGIIIETGSTGEWDHEVTFVSKQASLEAHISVSSDKSSKGSREKLNRESRDRLARETRKKSIMGMEKYSNELTMAYLLLSELESSYFKFTTTDGHVFIMVDGKMEKMLRPLYFKENFDFKLNELYVRREDGVKMLYSSKQTRCLYPDETEINTFLSEKLISSYMEFEFGESDKIQTRLRREEPFSNYEDEEMNFESKGIEIDYASSINSKDSHNDFIESSINFSESISLSESVQQANMINTVTNKIINFSADDSIRVVNRSFIFLHKNYETVHFDNTNGLVSYPESQIHFSRNKVSANLNDSLQLVCTVDGLEMVGMHCKMHSKMNLTKLWFSSTDDLIMSNDDGFNSRLSINRSGSISLENEFAPAPLWQDLKKCNCGVPKIKQNRYFSVGEGWNGYEIHSKPSMDRIIDDPNLLAVFEEDDCTTILKVFIDPLKKFGQQSRDENDKFHKDNHNLVCCEPTLELAAILRKSLPDKILLRHFVKISTAVTLADSSSRQSTISTSRQKSKTLTNSPISEILCQSAQKVLEWHLSKMEKKHIEENTPLVKTLSKRFVEMSDKIKNEFARAHLYRRMLRTGFVPLFFDDFVNAKEHVSNLDTDQMMAYMDAVDEHSRLQIAMNETKILPSVDDIFVRKFVSELPNSSMTEQKTECAKPMKCECCHQPCLCDAYNSIEVNRHKIN